MKKIAIILLFLVLTGNCVVPAEAADRSPSCAADEISTAIDLGLVPDELQSNYSVGITRSEFASLIMRLQHVWEDDFICDVTADTLKTLKTDDYEGFTETADENVIDCAALGILDGDGGHLIPDEKLTRQQAAKILYKACQVFASSVFYEVAEDSAGNITSSDMPHSFLDGEKIRTWARTPINWCYRHNIMSGVRDNQFAPDDCFTREQAILTVLRLYDLNGRSSENSLVNEPDYYPIYSYDTNDPMDCVDGWVESSFVEHSRDEIGCLPDREAKVGFILDNVGAGVSYGHLIDQRGNMLLTDLWGTGGYFYRAEIDYPYIWVETNYIFQHDDDAPFYGVVNIETGEIWENEMLGQVTGKDYSVQDTGPAVIAGAGWYHLSAADGAVLSRTYENAMLYIGGSLYLGWVSYYPCTYDVIYCDGVNMSRVIRTEKFRFNPVVVDLGGGVYAAQNTDTQISVFDAFGETLSTITTDRAVILEGSANGLLYLNTQDYTGSYYYTQTGKLLSIRE